MAKKKTKDKTGPKDVFKINPFAKLKGAVVASQAQPVEKAVVVESKAPQEADDTEIFLQAMSGVNRLGGRPAKSNSPPSGPADRNTARPPISDKRSELARMERDAFAKAIKEMKLDVKFTDQLPEDEELKAIGGNRLRQLKRGVITVERQLDLHGLTRIEALEALPVFFQSAINHGEKAVLVITGKGVNSPGEPVIQQAVAAWLRDAGRKYAVEFAPAPKDMGGSGAFIVFLRSR